MNKPIPQTQANEKLLQWT